MAKKALVCGAGYVGSRVARALRQSGLEVTVLRKSDKQLEDFKTISCDFTSKSCELGSYDWIFLAFSPGAFNKEAYERTFIRAYEKILENIDEKSLQNIVMISSTSVYSQMDGSVVTEDDVSPSGFSGETLLKSENMLRDFYEKSCILRLSGIYGPGRLSVLEKVRNKDIYLSEAESSYTNRIHIDDIVKASIFAFEKGLSGPYNLSDSHPVRKNEFLKTLATMCGVELEVGPSKPSMRRTNKIVSNQKILDAGYVFKYPDFEMAYKDMLRNENR